VYYVAMRELKADGKVYERGRVVPAESWKTLRALLSLGWVAPVDAVPADGSDENGAAGVWEPEKGASSGGADQAAQDGAAEPREPNSSDGAVADVPRAVRELLARPIRELGDALGGVNDPDVVREALQWEERTSARELMEKRLAALGEEQTDGVELQRRSDDQR